MCVCCFNLIFHLSVVLIFLFWICHNKRSFKCFTRFGEHRNMQLKIGLRIPFALCVCEGFLPLFCIIWFSKHLCFTPVGISVYIIFQKTPTNWYLQFTSVYRNYISLITNYNWNWAHPINLYIFILYSSCLWKSWTEINLIKSLLLSTK